MLAAKSDAAVFELTPEERAAYVERGYFVRNAAFGERELETLRAAVEDIHVRISREAATADPIKRIDGRAFQMVCDSSVKWEWREETAAIRSMEPFHHLSPVIDDFIDDERLCAPARGIIGVDEVSLFTDKLNFKRAGGSPFPWHQDAPYWAFGCQHLDKLVSMQIYLDEATEENGCLWMLPESHRFGHIPPPKDRGVIGGLYTDISHIAHLKPEPIVAPAGSIIFFDGYIVHGSMTNHTNNSRRAIILTYQPASLPRWNLTDVRVPVRDRKRDGGLHSA